MLGHVKTVWRTYWWWLKKNCSIVHCMLKKPYKNLKWNNKAKGWKKSKMNGYYCFYTFIWYLSLLPQLFKLLSVGVLLWISNPFFPLTCLSHSIFFCNNIFLLEPIPISQLIKLQYSSLHILFSGLLPPLKLYSIYIVES